MIHLLLGLQAQTQENFRARDDSVVIAGIEKFTKLGLNNENGDRSFAGTGHPVRVELNTMGLSLASESIDVTAKQNTDQSYTVSEAHAKTNVRVIVDSAPASQYAKKNGKKPPTGAYRFLLNTAAVDYAGSQKQGEATLPAPFDMTGHLEGARTAMEKGKPAQYAYTETLAMRGSSGKLTIDPSPGAGVRAIQSGHFDGPVEFSGVRTETNLDTKAVSTMSLENGACDSVDIATDPNGETITLKGHVSFDLDTGQGVVPIRNGQVFVVRLDPTLAIVSVKGTGAPLETSVPLQPKKQ